MLSAFASTIDKWDAFQTINYPHGHCILTGYMGLRPQDPDTLEYEAMMQEAYGEEKARGDSSRQHPPRAGLPLPVGAVAAAAAARLRPLGVDRTLTEIWHFRLKGAPEAIYRRSLAYYNLVNSPATLINADDLENSGKCQQGLPSDGGDWVSFHRHFGRDIEKDGVLDSNNGTSEVPMRNQFRAWARVHARRPDGERRHANARTSNRRSARAS